MELNREQIIKAFEICRDQDLCNECPYEENIDCLRLKEKHAIELMKSQGQKIDELTEENERLKAQNETLEINNKDFKYRIYELSRDNEEWEHENKDLECDNDMLRERITEIKSDTVRKIRERLTLVFDRLHKNIFRTHEVRKLIIDQIAKEMLEEK